MPGFVLLVRQRGDGDDVLGIGYTVSKKVGNAPERARAKRRLRDAFRRNRSRFTASADDVILVARRSILKADWRDVVSELLKLASQAGLIPSP